MPSSVNCVLCVLPYPQSPHITVQTAERFLGISGAGSWLAFSERRATMELVCSTRSPSTEDRRGSNQRCVKHSAMLERWLGSFASMLCKRQHMSSSMLATASRMSPERMGSVW